MTTIADCLAPEVLAQLGQTFCEGLEEFIDPIQGWDCGDWIESRMGFTTSEHLWDALWRFGVIVDEGTLTESTIDNPKGIAGLGWYMPSDHDITVQLIELGEIT